MVRGALIAALLLAGCGTKTEYIRVNVPVPTRVEPPAELIAPVEKPAIDGPVFVTPDDSRAVLGITEPGRQVIVDVVNELTARDRAWRAWALEPE